MIRVIKKILKNNRIFQHAIALLLFNYLRFVYATSKWEYIFLNEDAKNLWHNMHKTIMLAWHDKLAILPYTLRDKSQNLHLLVSPHSDGMVIGSVLKLFGFNIIAGSTNKNSLLALKQIIKSLNEGCNIGLTPDGPRGPRHKINSNIIEIAKKYDARILPISCKINNYKPLPSWDRLLFPLPFGKIQIFIGHPIDLAKQNMTNESLAEVMDNLVKE